MGAAAETRGQFFVVFPGAVADADDPTLTVASNAGTAIEAPARNSPIPAAAAIEPRVLAPPPPPAQLPDRGEAVPVSTLSHVSSPPQAPAPQPHRQKQRPARSWSRQPAAVAASAASAAQLAVPQQSKRAAGLNVPGPNRNRNRYRNGADAQAVDASHGSALPAASEPQLHQQQQLQAAAEQRRLIALVADMRVREAAAAAAAVAATAVAAAAAAAAKSQAERTHQREAMERERLAVAQWIEQQQQQQQLEQERERECELERQRQAAVVAAAAEAESERVFQSTLEITRREMQRRLQLQREAEAERMREPEPEPEPEFEYNEPPLGMDYRWQQPQPHQWRDRAGSKRERQRERKRQEKAARQWQWQREHDAERHAWWQQRFAEADQIRGAQTELGTIHSAYEYSVGAFIAAFLFTSVWHAAWISCLVFVAFARNALQPSDVALPACTILFCAGVYIRQNYSMLPVVAAAVCACLLPPRSWYGRYRLSQCAAARELLERADQRDKQRYGGRAMTHGRAFEYAIVAFVVALLSTRSFWLTAASTLVVYSVTARKYLPVSEIAALASLVSAASGIGLFVWYLLESLIAIKYASFLTPESLSRLQIAASTHQSGGYLLFQSLYRLLHYLYRLLV